jgi:flavin reductase (DIM6/NTAB) family NADH-FMN oxidoreductase RutF
MANEELIPTGEMLRRVMRNWATGVAVVTSRHGDRSHGMTVNSFISISLEPPLVTVTMANSTRTFALVQQSGIFAVTILASPQQPLAELFAGRIADGGDRLAGLDVFTMVTGAPLLMGGLGFVDCRVVHAHPLLASTLFIGEVVAARPARPLPDGEEPEPLVYYDRAFCRLK